MARILLLPDDHTLLVFRMPGSAWDWATALNSGRQSLPSDPEHPNRPGPALPLSLAPFGPLQAEYQHDLVIVTPASASRLAAPFLSWGELQVLRALADGLTPKEISQGLDVALGTISYHLRQIRLRLNAATNEQAVARAVAWGLIQVE